MAKAKRAPAAPKGPTVRVNSKLPDGKPLPKVGAESARGLYVARLAEYNGKPLAEFKASCKANPPSMPKKGKYAGKQEPFSGWQHYLTRTGFMSVID